MRFAAYVLDIEGTTTPIDFVTKTLFPFARRELRGFLARSMADPEANRALIKDCELLADDHFGEPNAPTWPDVPSPLGALDYLYWLMDHDVKSTGLKSIQGRIWEEGYTSGAIQGEVYADVWPAVQRWKDRGAKVYIYSSGSVLAQKLLFSHLPDGDMTTLLDGYFDTTAGPKRSPESYKAIARKIGLAPDNIAFLSDVTEETLAARDAGMWSFLVQREGEAHLGEPPIRSFDELE